ncbi:putative endo-beta-1,4-glucanase D [Bisporella sp. PMI_857]|nr:putative endo-beta-1,4-glucanase D [Bisporella sp. PMI_857]
MRFTSALVSAALASSVAAHATIWNIYVNDVDQGVGNSASGYIRSPPSNSPIKDITSTGLTCNVNNAATAKTITVAAGDKITFEWHHNDNSAGDDIIDPSHLGPVLTYIAPTSSNGAGDVWVKLAEDGFKDGTWAVTTLIANKGKHSVTLPSGLAAGKYLLRPEIIALHESDSTFDVNPARGAQFYMECVQIEVTSGGSTTLPTGVAIPGAYSYSDPGVHFNLYGSFSSYSIPGPAVWNGASSGTTPASSSKVVSSTASKASAAPVVSTTAPAVSTTRPAVSATQPAVSATRPAASATRPATTFATVVKPSTSGSCTAPTGVAVAKWGQCGGINFTGSTTCVSGSTCQVQNPYYSQCL